MWRVGLVWFCRGSLPEPAGGVRQNLAPLEGVGLHAVPRDRASVGYTACVRREIRDSGVEGKQQESSWLGWVGLRRICCELGEGWAGIKRLPLGKHRVWVLLTHEESSGTWRASCPLSPGLGCAGKVHSYPVCHDSSRQVVWTNGKSSGLGARRSDFYSQLCCVTLDASLPFFTMTQENVHQQLLTSDILKSASPDDLHPRVLKEPDKELSRLLPAEF